jgi:hypothetical protein
MEIHRKILEEVRNHPSVSTDFKALTDEQLLKYIFKNFRGKVPNTKGLQLSIGGFELIKPIFTYYEIPVSDDVDARDLIKFNRNVRFPFFVDKKKWRVFDSDLATMLKMVDGSLKKIVEMEIF